MSQSLHASRASLLDTFRCAVEEVSDSGQVCCVLAGDTPLDHLGLDSVQVAELFSTLEERLDLHTSPEAYFSAVTVNDVLDRLDRLPGRRCSA